MTVLTMESKTLLITVFTTLTCWFQDYHSNFCYLNNIFTIDMYKKLKLAVILSFGSTKTFRTVSSSSVLCLRPISETGRCDEEVLSALHHGCEDREEKLRPVCIIRKT